MSEKKSLRILTISLNAWNDSMPTGNTFSNLFRSIPTQNISNIYCRKELICNDICSNYFCVTEKDILKNLFSKNKCGCQINKFKNENISSPMTVNSLGIKQKIRRLLQKYRPTLLLFLRELIWDTGIWKNKKLDEFVKHSNPDIIYMHGHYNLYTHKILSYCRQISGAKVAIFFGDDMYSYKSRLPLKLLYQAIYRIRLHKSVSQASVLFGITKQLCDEYRKIFNCEFHQLCKCCFFLDEFEKEEYNQPLCFVYAGNLLYGRDKVLIRLKNAIDQSNLQNSLKCQLKIYSSTVIGKKVKSLLTGENSFFMGPRPYSEISDIMSKADIVLHVESGDKKQIRNTRLSFSTKIIDCMQSGSAMFVIGPDSIASVKQIKDSGYAFVACSEKDILNKLLEIVKNPDLIADFAKKMRKYAQDHHDVRKVQDDFYKELLQCCYKL